MIKKPKNLRGTVIASYLLRKAGVGQEALAERLFPEQKEPRKKIQRWLSGGGIGASNRQTIENAYPETKALFDSPLFILLGTESLKEHKIEQLLEPYKVREPSLDYWKIPNHSLLNPSSDIPIYGKINSKALAESGCVDGFVIILGLIQLTRSSKVDNSFEARLRKNAEITNHLIQAARAFPNVARHPAFKPYWQELYKSFKELWLCSLADPCSLILNDELMIIFIEMEYEYRLWRGAYGRSRGELKLFELPTPVIQPTQYESIYP